MTAGEINDMNVITNAGAIGGRVIAAKDAEFRPTTDRHLRDERHQIIGNALRVFADQTALMRPDRVEITQQGHAPARIRGPDIPQHLLDVQLGAPVGVGRLQLGGFIDRHHFRVPINRGRRAEYQPEHLCAGHRLEQPQRTDDIVVVIAHRQRHRLTDCLQAGKMDDRLDRIGRKNPVQRIGVTDVPVDQLRPLATNLLDALQHLGRTVAEIIENQHIVVAVQQLDHRMRANIARATCHQNHESPVAPALPAAIEM